MDWAVKTASEKKKKDFSKVKFFKYNEGLCVQQMHIGSYDDEPTTIENMHKFVKSENYQIDIKNPRYHHEIYLSDPRKCDISKLKTVIIPGSVKTIGAGAFSLSRSLAELTIEEGVETIGDGAFGDCYSLKSVEIPKSVLTIYDGTFLNCSGIREIKVSNDNPNYTSENGILYNKDKTKIIK